MVLHEALTTSFGVDFLETLHFLSPRHNTQSSEEEPDDDGHETINSAENVVQRRVCELGDRSNAETVCSRGGSLARTEITTECDLISGIEITAASERVLNLDLCGIALHSEYRVIVILFVQRVEPDICADTENCNSIHQE